MVRSFSVRGCASPSLRLRSAPVFARPPLPVCPAYAAFLPDFLIILPAIRYISCFFSRVFLNSAYQERLMHGACPILDRLGSGFYIHRSSTISMNFRSPLVSD
jgi:hypothetical protein